MASHEQSLAGQLSGVHLSPPAGDSAAMSGRLNKKRSQRFTVQRNPTSDSFTNDWNHPPPPVPSLPASHFPSHQVGEQQFYQQPPLHQFYSTEQTFDSPPPRPPETLQYAGQYPPSFQPAPPQQDSSNWNQGNFQSPQQTSYAMANGYLLPGQEDESDEVIPTAIVMKNIPFSLPREQVLAIMESLALSPPYAFNYHYDMPPPGSSQPSFRGLAFANFRTPQETSAALAALNGYEIQGRRLRVEYKRVLRHGEKEKIEREKAIKRMRSAVGLNSSPVAHVPSPVAYHQQSFGMPTGQLDDFGYGQPSSPWSPIPSQAPMQHPSTFAASPTSNTISTPSHLAMHSPGSSDLDANSANDSAANFRAPGSGSSSASLTPKNDLDMNDSQTLEIYSRVLLFKDDTLRDELAFARSLNGHQRHVVHLVAQRLGLDHRSVGENDDRYVIVYKPRAESDLVESPTNKIRAKKSMPDMRNSQNLNGNSPGALGIRKSSVDLRSSLNGRRAQTQSYNQAPPVPAIPSTYDEPLSPTMSARRAAQDSYARGFAGRSQVNNWRNAP